jgi:hypothetical protein
MVTDTPLEIKELLRIYNISPGMSASILPLKDAGSGGLSLELEEPPELWTIMKWKRELYGVEVLK